MRSLTAALTMILLAGCAGADPVSPDDASGTTGRSITIDGAEALQWGDGDYGVVLAHGAAFDAASWQAQAVPIAAQGASVIAVEDTSPDAILGAVERLHDAGVEDVALVGGSAGADAILQLVSEQPDVPDQLILISPNTTAEGLGDEPKLFIASADEPLVDVARELGDSASGDDNEVLILPGSGHAQNIFDTDQAEPLLQAILERLERFATG